MAQIPQTKIQLFKLDNCDSSYKFVSNFVNNTVDEYFDWLPNKLSYVNIQYIRKNDIVDIPQIYDVIEDYNYCRYDNGEGRGWEYAFIKEKQFINFSVTRISLQFDVWNNNLDKIKSSDVKNTVTRMHFNPSEISNIVPDMPANPTYMRLYGALNEEIGVKHMVHIVLNDKRQTGMIPFYDPVKWFDVDLDDIDDEDFKTILSSPAVNAVYYYNIPTLMFAQYDQISSFQVIEDVRITAYLYDSSIPDESVNEQTRLYGHLIYTEPVSNMIDKYDDKKIWTYPYTKFLVRTYKDQAEINLGKYDTFNVRCNVHLSSNGVDILYTSIDKYNNITFIKDCGLTAPMVINNYDKYHAYNQSFMLGHITDIFSKFTNLALRGGTTTKVSGYASVASDAFSSVMGYVKEYGKVHDLIIAPENVNTVDSIGDLFMMLYNNPLIGYFVTSTEEVNSIFINHWNVYGYPCENKKQINECIRTRKFYNFLSISDFYIPQIYCEDERLQLAQIMKNGVRIYHTWKGDTSIVKYGQLLSNTENFYMEV